MPRPKEPTNCLMVMADRSRQEEAVKGVGFYSFTHTAMFDPMSDLTDDSSNAGDPSAAPLTEEDADDAGHPSGGHNGNQFGKELHSITIHARQRTFYIDLKESSNGKFFKVSEKSRGGRKSTIMFDAEDLEEFIKAFNDMKSKM